MWSGAIQPFTPAPLVPFGATRPLHFAKLVLEWHCLGIELECQVDAFIHFHGDRDERRRAFLEPNDILPEPQSMSLQP